MKFRLASTLAGLSATALIAAACSNEPSIEEVEGYGEAVVALNVSSIYALDDGDLRGRILLMNADGSLRQQPTDGIYMGTVSLLGDSLVSSDAHREWIVGRDSSKSLDRSGENLMEWDSFATDSARWTVFNDGAQADGYTLGVSVTDGEQVSETKIIGEPYGTTGCGDTGFVVTRGSGNKSGSFMHTLSWTGESITVDSRRVVDPNGARVTNVTCVDEQPVLLSRSGGQLHVGTRTTATEPFEWRSGWTQVSLDSRSAGAIGDLVFIDTGHKLIALDTKTLERRVLVGRTGGEFAARVQGNEIIAWWQRDGEALIVRIDPGTGAEKQVLDASEVLEHLNAHDESVIRPPILLPQRG